MTLSNTITSTTPRQATKMRRGSTAVSFSSIAKSAISILLASCFVNADVSISRDIDEFNSLAEAHDGFPFQEYRSSPIKGPVFHVNSWDRNLTDDSPYYFIGSVYGENGAGPMIIDASDLSLVYADQKWENSYYSQPWMIDGSPHLAFWEGYHARGHANGFCLIMDDEYNVKYNVSAVGLHGALADMHEMQVTDDETVIFTTYFNIPYDCTHWDGDKDCLLMDSGFQEVDMETNRLIFEWSASKHFDPKESFAGYGENFGVGDDSGFDFAHINSAQKTEDGNYLVSGRHLCTLALVDGEDGHLIWVLGGKKNQFRDLSGGRATDFGWQHDARFYKDGNHITMFDNHGQHSGSCNDEVCRTRGLHIEIDVDAMTARVLNEYYHPQRVNAGAMGGMQMLPNGNALTAWGWTPSFVEFSPDGRTAIDFQRGRIGGKGLADMFAYRVYKGNWTGRPSWLPSVAVDAPHGTASEATLHMSWNGATDIDTWAVFSSHDINDINSLDKFLGVVARDGFETAIALESEIDTRFVAVAAIDKDENVLGSSFIFDMKKGQLLDIPSNILSIQPTEVSGSASLTMMMLPILLIFVAFVGLSLGFRRCNTTYDMEKAGYKQLAMD